MFTVLLVEDHELTLEVLSEILHLKLGHGVVQILPATTIVAAWNHYRASPPDLIVLDGWMKKTTGDKVSTTGLLRDFIRAGLNAHVIVASDDPDLATTLERILKEHQISHERVSQKLRVPDAVERWWRHTSRAA